MITALPVATAIVYVILIQPILYCAWKHGKRGLLGWLVLQMFCAVRIVGSILEILHEKNGSLLTASLIVPNIGLSPLLLGVLGVLHEARTARNPYMNTKIEWVKVFAFHGKVVLAMVLLIIGIVHEISDKTTVAPPIAKVGAVLLLFCSAVLSFWTLHSFNQKPRTNLPAWNDATILLTSVVYVLPYIVLRTLYSVIYTFSSDLNFKENLAAKVCMSVVPEMLLIVILAVRGIMTRNLSAKRQKYPMEYGPLATMESQPLKG